MTNFNFLSKSSSQSCGHSSVTLASTVGSPSAHRRSTMLRLLSVLVLVLTFGVGQMWGVTFTAGTDVNSTKTITKDGVTLTLSSGCADLDDYSEYRIYASNSFTISSSSNIISIVVTTNTAKGNATKLSVTSGYSASGTSGTWSGKAKSVQFSASEQVRVTQIVVTLEASYSVVWTINPVAGGTLSTTSGASTTVTPNSAYTYGNPAYSVTSGTASVSQSSNTFTATPSANCTIRINMVEKTKYTLNYHDGDGDGTRTNIYEGTNLITALGTPAESCDATSTTFVGWATTEIATKTDSKPTLVSADAVVNSTTAAAKYYAVYAKSNTGSWSLTSIDKLNNSSGYAGYNGSHTASGISYTSNQVMAQSSTIQFQSNSGYMYNTTVMSADITSIVITSSSANWSVYTSNSTISSTPASGAISISSSGNTRTFTVSATGHKYFHIKGGASTPQATNITVNYGTTKDYITTCCSPLGSINGSVSWTNSTTAVLRWNKLSSQVSSWGNVTYGTSGSTACAVDPSDNTLMRCTIPNLTCGTEYTFTLHPTLKSGVCEIEEGKDSTIVASYPKPTITLDKEGTSNGDFSISGNLTSQCPGENVTVLLSPNSGYEVDALTIGEDDYASSVSNNSYTFEMPSSNVTIHATFKTSAKPSVDINATEGLTENTLSFSNVEKEANKALTITVTGSNLTHDITWALADTDDESADMFSISPSNTTIGKGAATSGQDLVITFTPATTKTYTATLTFSTTGALADKVITLTGTGVNLYTVTLNAGTGSISDGSWTESEGVWTKKQGEYQEELTLPDATIGITGWSFAGWKTAAVSPQTDAAQTFEEKDYTPEDNITLYAVYQKSTGSANYELVESDLGTAWAGDYLIAYSSSIFADGRTGGTETGAIGAASSAVDPSTNLNGKVVAASWGDTYNVTLEEISENSNTYVLKTKDGKYNYHSSNDNNGLTATSVKNTAAAYPISVTFTSSSDVKLALGGDATGSVFRFNAGTANQPATYFRFYKNCGQNAVYLYKKGSPAKSYYSNPSDKVTLTYDANGATAGEAPGAQGNITIGTGVTVAAKPEALAKTGYDFGGWNTKDDGTGTNYAAGTGEITMTDNITLYAKWTKHNYTVAVADVDHTIITATPQGGSAIAEKANAAVAYEKEVTLAKTDDPHFTVAWDVYETGNSSNKVTVSEGKFTVPAFDVTVSATFTEDAKRNVIFYSNGAQLGTTQEVYVDEAPVAETAVYEDCLEGSNQFYGWATEEWTGAIDASTLAGKTVETGALPEVAAGEGDVKYYAVWAKGTATPSNSYAAITSGLAEDNYVIAYSYNGGTQIVLTNAKDDGTSDTQLEGEALSLSDSKYVTTEGKYIWELQAQNDESYYIYNAALEKYLNATTTALSMSSTPTKFTITYDGTNSRWTIKLKDNNTYYMHGYVSGTNYDFRVSTSGSGNKYRTYLYKNEKETSYSDFRTNCCSLKPVTNVQVGTIGETSIELTWTAPTSKTGINKYQIVDAEHEIAQDVTDVDATSATVTGLTECTTYNFKVVSVGDDCNSNSNEVEATPFAGAKVVTFDYNGGSGATTSASTSCGVATVNLPTPNDRAGYNFKGWNDGTQTLAPSTATYTPAATMTLTAQWAQLYTVHYEFAGASGAPEDAQYEAGATVELPSEPNKGFLAPFEAWDYSEAVTMVDKTHFTMPAKNLTITATYDEIIGQWILVNDENTLSANDMIVIGSGVNNVVAGEISSQVMASVSASFTQDKTVLTAVPNDAVVLKLGGTSSAWTLNRLSDNKKLGATAEKKLAWDGASATETWTISIENNDATILNGTSSYGNLQYNSGSPRFTTYTSSQTLPQIYRFREGIFYNINMPASAPTGGTVSANTSMEKAGETVTLTYKPSRGYTVKTLTVTGATSGDDIAINPALEAGVTEYTFTMPAEAVTVAASFEEVDPVDYYLVTDAANLAVGMKFLLVGSNAAGDTYKASGAYNSDHLDAIGIDAPSENKISISTEEVEEITLEGESGAWKLISHAGALREASKNLYITGTPSNWTISISEGLATITSENSKPLLYNTSSPRFKPYDGTTDQLRAVTLYALPYTTYNFVLDGCKTIKVVTGYTYTYTIKNSDEPSSTPGDNYKFLHKWTDGTNTYGVGDEVTVSAAKTLQPCWKVTTPEEEDVTDIDGLPESVTEIVVNKDKNLNVNDDRTINTLTIKSTSGAMDVAGTSGQVTGDNTLTVTDNLFLEIKLRDGDMDAEASRKWYCISAPFDVAINGGFFWGDGTPMVLNTHFQLFEWDGDRRATGASGWRRTSSDMQAGVAYFIGFDDARSNQNTIKLKAMSNTISNTNTIEAPSHGNDGDYANWSGLGNPNFHHIALDKNVQAFDYNKQGYSPYATGAYNFVVGTPFFIQYAGDIAVSAANGSNPYRAPQRESDIYSYCVRIGSAEASRADNQIYVRASETASAEFDNERDMITMNGTSSNYGALLWTENYGGKRLAIEEAPLVNGTASYVLTLSAPANGTYSISVAAAQENADLYLTYEGAIIWNLSMGAYTMDLNKGITNGYGLLLQAKAPNAATGIEDSVFSDQSSAVQKVIIDEHVYILRGGQMYDVNGKMVK